MKPVVQLALDFVELDRALKAAQEAVAGGVDWLEAGTPLIKSEGLDAVRALRKAFPDHTIVADMKIMDAGRVEAETAAKAGANVVDVLGAASDATIRECVEAARHYGLHVVVDTIAVEDVVKRAKPHAVAGLSCAAGYVGRHDDILERPEILVQCNGSVRLVLEHVQRRARQVVICQCIEQGQFVDDRAARGIDQPSALRDLREAFFIQEVMCLWRGLH